jgi:hypothetical protein
MFQEEFSRLSQRLRTTESGDASELSPRHRNPCWGIQSLLENAVFTGAEDVDSV